MPVFGLNLLSFEEIPIIYSLYEIKLPEASDAFRNYYRNLRIGTIADTSYKMPSLSSYFVHANYKPELMLLTLENYLGEEKMMGIFREFFETYKFKHARGEDFINIVLKNSDEDLSWFFENVYENSYVFDYRIRSIKQINKDEYEVFVERLGDGIFKNSIALYTENDTLYKKWDGKERWKILKFKTDDKVVSAEIDPERINLLDINFANNSYTVDKKYWASLSLAARWFFWVQNALMILGSVG